MSEAPPNVAVPPVPVWRKALQGAVEGASSGLLLWFVLEFVGTNVPSFWPTGALIIALGALLLSICRVIAGGIVTALAVGLGGLLIGVVLGQYLPWQTTYVRSDSLSEEPKRKARFGAGDELDIAGPGLDGGTIDIKKYRGKVVLVDFWATWCPPCRAALPELLELYKKQHKAGFEIIGVTLDANRGVGKERVKTFLQDHGIPWPQIYEDRTMPLAQANEVQGIPETFLFNREGKLVARGLHGQGIADAVEVLLDPDIAPAEVARKLDERSVHLGRVFGAIVGLFLGGIGGAFLQRRLDQASPAE